MTNDSGGIRFEIELVAKLENVLKDMDEFNSKIQESGRYVDTLKKRGETLEDSLGAIFKDAIDSSKNFQEAVRLVSAEMIKTGATGKKAINSLVTALADFAKVSSTGENKLFDSDEAKRFMDIIRTAGTEAKAIIQASTEEVLEQEAATERLNQSQRENLAVWNEIRKGIDSAKTGITAFAAETGSSLRQATDALKERAKVELDTDEARQRISDLSAGFRELTQEEKNVAIEAKETADAIRAGFGDPAEAAKVLIDNTIRAREELKELVETGLTLDEAEEALKRVNSQLSELNKFSPKEISSAVSSLKQEAKLAEAEQKKLNQAVRDFGKAEDFGKADAGAITFRNNVEAAKAEMMSLRATTDLTSREIVEGMRRSAAATGRFSSTELQEAKKQLQDLGVIARETGGRFGKLDGVLSTFFGVTLASLAQQAIQRTIRLMQDLAERGREVSDSFFTMAVAVRGLQRLGTEITLAEVTEQVERLAERFSFFTQTEIRTGIGQILLLTRNLGFTKQQMFELSEATAALAIVTGKDFGEQGLLVARAIASGYTEALQRAGIEASRFTIQQEAMKQGINKAFNAMTQGERGLVTLNLILDQVGTIEEDVARKSETLEGRFKSMTVTVKELADSIGTKLFSNLVAILDPIDRLTNSTGGFLASLDMATGGTAGNILNFFETLRRALSNTTLLSVPILLFTAAVNQLSQAFKFLTGSISADELKTLEEELTDTFGTLFNFIAGETGSEAFDDVAAVYEPFSEMARLFGDASEETAESIEKDLERLADKMADIIFDYQNDLDDALIDYKRRLEDINIEEARVLGTEESPISEYAKLFGATPTQVGGELNEEEQAKLDEINRKEREKLLEAEIDYEADREKIIRTSGDKIAAAQQKFREKELQAQIEFQEKQRKLREGFLFDLDDALRDRDAQQVLQLTRQFNLQNTQLQRDEQIASAERQRQFQLELSQIAQQREIRLRELEIEYQLKRDQIARNSQRERDLNREKFEEERAEQKERFDQKRADAELDYKRELEDADLQYARRFEQLTANLDREELAFLNHGLAMINIAATTISQINRIYSSLLGGGGTSYAPPSNWYENQTIPSSGASSTGGDFFPAPPSYGSGAISIGGGGVYIPPPDEPDFPGFAEGGTIVAKKPTVAVFGERGAEAVSFTPLNRSGADVNKVFNGNLPRGFGGGGSTSLRVYLEPGLKAEIVNQALGEVADVIVEEIRR